MLSLLTHATRWGLENSLRSTLPDGKPVRIVAPSPVKADALRAQWGGDSRIQVLTVAAFVDELLSVRGKEEQEGVRGKARMLLLLNLFKNHHPEHKETDYGTFKMAHQVFSDFSAYTDAPEIPDELLSPFVGPVADLVRLFHQGTRMIGVRDEHGTLFDLTAELRATEGLTLPGNPVVVFDGFTFLSPAQLSLLEGLAIRHEVIVPIPRRVLEGAGPWDWPSALRMSAHEVRDSGEERQIIRSVPTLSFPKGGMGEALRRWRGPVTTSAQIVLGGKTPSAGVVEEIPFADAFTKREVDVTAQARSVLWERWEARLARLSQVFPAREILRWCEEERASLLQLKDMGAMPALRVIGLVEEALALDESCLEGQELNAFWLKLLAEVVALNAPRNSMVPLMRETPAVRVESLKTLGPLDPEVPTALCIGSGPGALKSDHRPHVPELEKELAKLGPVKRPELEFLFARAELDELLTHPKLTLVVEEEFLNHELSWKEALEEVSLLESAEIFSSPPPMPADFNFFKIHQRPEPIERMSASRLQDFLDCPRLYHAKRVAKLIPEVSLPGELDPMEIGTIEHKLVALAWDKGEAWWSAPGQLEKEASRLLDESISKTLRASARAAALAECAIHARNGLIMLAQVQAAFPGNVFQFEVELTAPGRRGSIDCLGLGGPCVVLIDFKRAKGMNPSFNQWGGREKIQLWFYLRALGLSGVPLEKVAVGYFFFKNADESWIATNDPLEEERLRGFFGKGVKNWEESASQLERYGEYEDQALQALREESIFAPAPRDPKICDHCSLLPLCPGSGLEDDG